MRLCLVVLAFAVGAVAGACGSEELRLRPVAATAGDAAALEATRAALETRVQSLGLVDVKVVLDSAGFVVKVSPDKAPPGLLRILAAPGRVTFVRIPAGAETPETGSPIPAGFPQVLGPEAVQPGTSAVGMDSGGQPTVNFHLTQPAAEVFRLHTRDHVGEAFAIVVDGRVIVAPTISSEIPDGDVMIQFGNDAPPAEISTLAAYLASGPLPVAIVPPGPD